MSKKSKNQWAHLSEEDQERVVRMAWEDRTSFDNIEKQFGLTANQVEQFMRTQLNTNAYKRWRRRANTQGHLKHEKKLPKLILRFKCSRQRLDGTTKGWK